MGRDKAQIELDGATLLERIAYVAHLVAPTIVVGRERPGDFEFARIPFMEDEEPGLGPVGGLRTALTHFDTPVVLLGCDMPLVKPMTLHWLLGAFAGSTARHGMVTTRNARVEPLFSVYRPACTQIIEDMLEEGRRALRGVIEHGMFDRADAPPEVAECLLNVNTPDELTALKRRL